MTEPARSKPVALVCLFLLHALPFLTRPVLLGGDEPHFALIAHSLATDADLDLADDYQAVAEGSAAAGRRFRGKELDLHVRRVGGRDLPAHPLGLPLLAAPLVRALEVGSPGAAPDALFGLLSLGITFAALLAGRRLLVERLGDERAGTAIALAVVFATPLWFTSRTFFTEPYLAALPVLAVFALTRSSRWRELLAGALLGAAFLIKESALVVVVPVLVGMALATDARRRKWLAIGPAVAAAVFVFMNVAVRGEPLATYHPFEIGDPLTGAVGLLFDLRHGLLPFAPLVLLTVLGLPRRSTRPRDPLVWAWLAFAGTFLLTALWAQWEGGSCYGPRLLVPAIPALAVPLAEAWRRFGNRRGFLNAFLILAAGGFGLGLAAAVDPFTAFWEASAPELLAGRPLVALGGALLAFLGLRRLLRGEPATV